MLIVRRNADTEGNSWNASAAPITVCADGSYCCGARVSYFPQADPSGPDCCDTYQGKFIVDGKATSSTPNHSGSRASHTPKSTSSAQPSNFPKSNHTGAIAGGVTGGVAGLVIIMVLIWFSLVRQIRKRAPSSSGHSEVEERKTFTENGSRQTQVEALADQAPIEAPTYQIGGKKVELDSRNVLEMDGTNHWNKLIRGK